MLKQVHTGNKHKQSEPQSLARWIELWKRKKKKVYPSFKSMDKYKQLSLSGYNLCGVSLVPMWLHISYCMHSTL